MTRKAVETFIERVKDLRVAVIGETILDVFIPVHYEGHSMKSACPVYRLGGNEEEVQRGGAGAIVAHLQEFVKSVDVFTNTGNEIVKTRYIDAFDKKKHVEINKFDTTDFPRFNINTADYDVTIVADFGHGFCDGMTINDGFHLMCQTNSNNFGFNRISKWKHLRKKSICQDLREASLQMNRMISATEQDILELYTYELNTEHLFITLGGKGSVFSDGRRVLNHPAYPSRIVDTIGAGDTFYSFACLVSALNDPEPDLTVPSLAASLSTTWLCNERSVTPESLLHYADQFIR